MNLRVSSEQWHAAQAYELSAWKRRDRPVHRLLDQIRAAIPGTRSKPGDDWNHWWRKQFDGYRALPDNISSALELGCGPYTNIRLILEGRHIDRVVCSDPLAKQYMKLRYSWLSEQASRGSIEVDNSPIEELPFSDESFDLVVLINVLDHVRDAVLCLRKAVDVTRPGGLLLIGQDLTNELDQTKTGPDIGHPIRIGRAEMDRLILDAVDREFYRILDRAQGRNPKAHYATYLMIGRKL